MKINNAASFFLLLFSFTCLFSGTILSITYFSDNKASLTSSYIPQVQAKLNFYQDENGVTNYTNSWGSFWSSESFYNPTYKKIRVTFWSESLWTTSVSPDIRYIFRNVSRDSH